MARAGLRAGFRALALRIVAAFGLMLALVAPAAAQNVDWVLNLDDTGYDPVPAGGSIIYSVVVTNNGFSSAPSTTLDFTVPATTTLVGISGDITGCTNVSGTNYSCPVPALASSESKTLQIEVLTSQSGLVTLSASVQTQPQEDGSTANNAQSEDTTVQQGSNVSLGLTGPATAASGETVSYTFTVTNNGPDTLTSADLQFPVPTGLVNVTPPAGCSLGGGVYTCALATPIANGNSVNLVFGGQISAAGGSTVTPAGSIINLTPDDPDTSDNSASLDTNVSGGTDLSITKTRSPSGTLLTGDTMTFTLAASYTGDSPTGLTITDTLPANYQIDSVTPSAGSGWTCSVSGQTVTCDRTSGAGAGANVSLGSISIDATIVSSGTPVNTATITAAGPADPNPANNSDDDGGVTIQDPAVDLAANKSGPNPALMVVGQTYGFPLSVTNAGNAPFVGTVMLTDVLPSQLDLVSYNLNGWSCSPNAPVANGPTVTCQRVYTAAAPLAAGATTPAVTVNASANTQAVITNSVTVSSPDGDIGSNGANDTATFTVTAATAPNSADLWVVKTARNASVISGDQQVFDIRVVNAGPAVATDVTVTDNLTNLINNQVGTGNGVVSIATSPGSSSGLNCSSASSGGRSRQLTCTIGNVPVCDSNPTQCPLITVTVTVGGNGGSRTNTAQAISSTVPDPDLGNNTGSASYTVTPRADMTVTKTDTPDPAAAGQNLTYVITARNLANGLSRADNVVITDTLPHGVTFVSASPSAGSCSVAPLPGSTTGTGNDQLVCDLGNINNGAQRTVTVVVSPNTATRGTTLTNNVSVATTTPETDLTNNTATETTEINNPVLDLLVNKTDTVDPVTVDDTTTYELRVTNLGPSVAENVVVTDTLPPAGLSYVSHTAPSDASCGTVPGIGSFGGTLECTFQRLEAGGSRLIVVTMLARQKGVHVNNVAISSDEIAAGIESNEVNNAATEDTTVRTRVDLEVVSKVASPSTVNLRDDFTFTITVRNNTGTGLAEADDVVVSDNLPPNMELVGTPSVTVISGSATSTSCTGAAGGQSFTCDLGTFSNGAVAEISVPVQVTSVSALPETIANTARITTTSFDINAANDINSGSVTVDSSTLSGTVYVDFDADDTQDPGDFGKSGVTLTLTGTSFDGAPISRTTTTAADGSYVFPYLPAGNYTVTRGGVSDPYLSDGSALPPASPGGTASGATVIGSIPLPPNGTAPGYDFTVIPQARILLAKRAVGTPTVNPDGSFNATFRLLVRNPSLEALDQITLTDALEGAAPLFGTHVSLGNPATDAMSRGTYTILSAPSGSCGGANAGFNGAGDQVVLSGASLAAGASCTFDFAVRVQPEVPLPPVQASGGRYENQARVTGEGVLSGQTSATNPLLADLSDNGANPDANGNGRGNDAGEDDPTPVSPSYVSSIALVKTADVSALSSPPQAGETISYTFAITNTGNVTLTNVTLSDSLPGIVLSGGPIASLAPGQTDSTTFTATYTLTQADIDAGQVTNQATATGTDPFDTDVSDLSGATVGDDDPTVTPVAQAPAIALVKTADASALSSPAQVGETITYTFEVTNTGNVTLTNVTLSDSLPGIVISGAPIASLAPGATDSTTFTATYTLTQADIDAGQVTNQATATGTPPSGPDVSDLSGATVGDDDPTVTPVAQAPGIALVKTADISALSSPPQAGETISYTFVVTNTGNVTLTNVTLSDTLPGIVLSGGPIASLAPGQTDSTTFTATYDITQADIDAGQVTNQATATGTPPSGPDVSDLSGATVGDDDPTVTPVAQAPGIALVKTADISALSSPPQAGDTVTYRFAITNTGNVTLTNVTLTDTLPGIVLNGAPIASLAPGATDSTTFTATYTLTQADVDAGQVTNQATATGTPPSGPDVSDLSGTTVNDDDPTVVTSAQAPAIALVKTATTAFQTPPQPGDRITYAFEVTNTGNVTLTNVTLSDSLPGIVISGGPIASLAPGQTDSTTFTATYDITQADIDAGRVTNQATATGTPPSGPDISDLSGATVGDDDPTVTPVGQTPAIALVKTATTAFQTPPQPGDRITYAFEVTNTGNVTLTNVTLSDSLPGIVISGGPIASLVPGQTDSTSFTATYDITQADIDAGQVTNQATATGTPPSGPDVSDLSGATVGDDDPTVTPVPQAPGIALVKTVDDSDYLDGPDPGDALRYAFAITNTGNVTLANVTLSDPLPGIVISGGPIALLAPGATDSTTYTATYVPTASDIAAGGVTNTATAEGFYGPGGTLSVTDTDSASATVVSVQAVPEVFPPFATDGGTTTSMLVSDIASGGPAQIYGGGTPTPHDVILTVIAEDPGVTLDPATGLITLLPGQPAGDYTVTYEICSAIVPTVCDQAVETVNQLPLPAIEVTKTQTLTDNGDGIDGVGDTLTYTIQVQNTGNTPLQGVTLTDTLTTLAGAPLILSSGPDFVSADAGSVEGDLQIGETATYTATFVLDIHAVTDGGTTNTVRADATAVHGPDVIGTPAAVFDVSDDGDDLDGNTQDDPTEFRVAPSLAPTGLTVTKTTPKGIVARGDIVPWTITIRNDNPVVSGQLDIVDVLPNGFLYVPSSATLEGVPYPVKVEGRVITWEDVPVPPLTTVTATLSTRVLTGADSGEHTNIASIRNPDTGSPLAPRATATVRILPEAVFDCGDVVGKVFDDRNGDGYQNDVGPAPIIDDDAMFGGKYGGKLAPQIAPEPLGEPGLPGVRLVGVDGTVITTDEHGRFHVPCAMLPEDRGSNFILKLDTRSLPTGYRVTTENPRVVRLTPGKATKLNFGAAQLPVVRIDLAPNAMMIDGAGKVRLSESLRAGIEALLPRIADRPVVVRLTWHLPLQAGADETREARRMLRRIEDHLRSRWRQVGRTKLIIEKTIVKDSE